jgi:hypothetical protein
MPLEASVTIVKLLGLWLDRLAGLGRQMKLTVRDVWVKGLPHDTTISPHSEPNTIHVSSSTLSAQQGDGAPPGPMG